MIKKIFGYIFLTIAAFLSLFILSQLKDIQNNIVTIFRYFISSTIDDFTVGSAVGGLLVDIAFMSIIIGILLLGKMWIKKKKY